MNDENEILIIGDVLSESVCARLAAAYKVHHIGGDNNARDQFIAAHGANIGAVITGGHGGCDDALMARLPALKIIASYGVGYDGIDTVAAAKRGVWVSNTPDVLNDDVADLALALMLAVVRQVVRLDDYVRVGEWQKRGDFALTDRLTGKRLGMLGMGRIGGAIVRRARAFDMAISYHATARKSGVDADFAASPVALAEGCDILCVAMPATEKTRGMVDAKVLRALGENGYLINIARGALVDEAALIRALQSGEIKGAGLDVFADEPVVPPALCALKNVVLTPHHASATIHTRRRMAELVADNVEAVLRGEVPVTAVNAPHGVTVGRG